MKHPNNAKRGRRFTSIKSANHFAKQVNGTVIDLRSDENSKSNFKVIYTKGDAKNRKLGYGYNPYDNK